MGETAESAAGAGREEAEGGEERRGAAPHQAPSPAEAPAVEEKLNPQMAAGCFSLETHENTRVEINRNYSDGINSDSHVITTRRSKYELNITADFIRMSPIKGAWFGYSNPPPQTQTTELL